MEEGRVEKLGRTPKTIYRFLADCLVEEKNVPYNVQENDEDFPAAAFLVVTELGNLLTVCPDMAG